VDLAFNKRVTVAAGQSSTIDLYVTIRGDLATALATADAARPDGQLLAEPDGCKL
jgi:hypothetical protein